MLFTVLSNRFSHAMHSLLLHVQAQEAGSAAHRLTSRLCTCTPHRAIVVQVDAGHHLPTRKNNVTEISRHILRLVDSTKLAPTTQSNPNIGCCFRSCLKHLLFLLLLSLTCYLSLRLCNTVVVKLQSNLASTIISLFPRFCHGSRRV